MTNMKTPIEVIKDGEEELGNQEWMKYIDSAQSIAMVHGFGEYAGETIPQYIKTHTATLIRSLKAEAEGRKMVVEMALGNPEAMAALRGYNDSITDQIKSYDELLDYLDRV